VLVLTIRSTRSGIGITHLNVIHEFNRINEPSRGVRSTRVGAPYSLTMGKIDAIKEIFLDYNMNNLLDLHEHLNTIYNPLGFLNTSKSDEFISCIMKNIFIVNSHIQIEEVPIPEEQP
jgi:hypothetical protein